MTMGWQRHAHHHEAGNQEGGIRNGAVNLYAVFQDVRENKQIQQRRKHGSGHCLETHFPEAHDFLAQQGGKPGAQIGAGFNE
jgi:hypothetical protein